MLSDSFQNETELLKVATDKRKRLKVNNCTVLDCYIDEKEVVKKFRFSLSIILKYAYKFIGAFE